MDYLQYWMKDDANELEEDCFKPCYKWITFNTKNERNSMYAYTAVLNLVINGLPSIPLFYYGYLEEE